MRARALTPASESSPFMIGKELAHAAASEPAAALAVTKLLLKDAESR